MLPQVPVPFSARVRESTRGDHERTERSDFVTDLLAGRIPAAGFAGYTAQLWFLYRALDAGAARLRTDPIVGGFMDARLARSEVLARDLEALLGPGWAGHVTALPATQTHAARIATLAATWPGGFVAHHYLRSLGDLSGGKVVGRAAQRIYGLAEDGVRFYHFEEIPSGRAFKEEYRGMLDRALWPAEEQERIVAEVGLGFRMSGAMFQELADAFGPT